jgi:hypothetical protein
MRGTIYVCITLLSLTSSKPFNDQNGSNMKRTESPPTERSLESTTNSHSKWFTALKGVKLS